MLHLGNDWFRNFVGRVLIGRYLQIWYPVQISNEEASFGIHRLIERNSLYGIEKPNDSLITYKHTTELSGRNYDYQLNMKKSLIGQSLLEIAVGIFYKLAQRLIYLDTNSISISKGLSYD